MRKLGVVGRTVYSGFRLGVLEGHRGKQTTLAYPTDDGETIYRACLAIHRAMALRPETVSYVGVSVRNLAEKASLPGQLLQEDRRQERLNRAIDRIRDRFGEGAIVTGETLLFEAIPEHVGGYAQGEEWVF